MKIVSAVISPMPKKILGPLPAVIATFEDGSIKELFEFYPDEINFTSEEFIGLTEKEAHSLHYKKDMAFLQRLEKPRIKNHQRW